MLPHTTLLLPVCNFGIFISFELGTLRSERVHFCLLVSSKQDNILDKIEFRIHTGHSKRMCSRFSDDFLALRKNVPAFDFEPQ